MTKEADKADKTAIGEIMEISEAVYAIPDFRPTGLPTDNIELQGQAICWRRRLHPHRP